MNKQKGAQRAAVITAAGAIFAALVAAVTLTIAIPIPATSGYFNFGETLIYVAALLFGPIVGLIAAPGTLAIKAMEGFLVGYLTKQLNKKIKSLTLSATIAITIGGFEMVAGYFLYETLILGYPAALALVEVPFNIVQMLVGLAIAIPIMHAVLRVFPQLKSYLQQ
jgi:uncharacterized membrane protein